jgi:hypothetical protein
VVGVTEIIGCAPTTPLPPRPSTPISISTFKDVEGKWAGILKATPRSGDDDWMTLMIHEDGSYHFESVRTVGIMHGQGIFAIIDGKLRGETKRGWGIVTLYEGSGQRRLRVAGATNDGVQYLADLDPTK